MHAFVLGADGGVELLSLGVVLSHVRGHNDFVHLVSGQHPHRLLRCPVDDAEEGVAGQLERGGSAFVGGDMVAISTGRSRCRFEVARLCGPFRRRPCAARRTGATCASNQRIWRVRREQRQWRCKRPGGHRQPWSCGGIATWDMEWRADF